MKRNWHIGQDSDDESGHFVSRGPFRYVSHPAFAGLVTITFSQGLLSGFDGRAFLLVVASVVYLVV